MLSSKHRVPREDGGALFLSTRCFSTLDLFDHDPGALDRDHTDPDAGRNEPAVGDHVHELVPEPDHPGRAEGGVRRADRPEQLGRLPGPGQERFGPGRVVVGWREQQPVRVRDLGQEPGDQERQPEREVPALGLAAEVTLKRTHLEVAPQVGFNTLRRSDGS